MSYGKTAPSRSDHRSWAPGMAVGEGEREGSGPPGRHRRKEELDLGRRRDVQVGGPAGCAGSKCESGREAQDHLEPSPGRKAGQRARAQSWEAASVLR